MGNAAAEPVDMRRDLFETHSGVVVSENRYNKMKKRKRRDQKDVPYGLLALPKELRTIIYELLLLQPEDITVDKHLRPPALLSVCQQLRSETLHIWHCRNKFNCKIYDCDGKTLLTWAKVHESLCIGRLKTSMQFCGEPNWGNLMTWCKSAHEERTSWLDKANDFSKLEGVIYAALHIARRSYVLKQPWSECELVLAAFRVALGTYDARWLR